MRKHRATIILTILSAAVLALSGCSAAASTDDTLPRASAGNATQQTQLSDATYVQVQSIDGDTITALIGTMTQPAGQQEANGQSGAQGAPEQPAGDGAQNSASPEQPAGDSGNSQQGTPPEQPSGDGAQSGAQGMPGGRMEFTAGDAILIFKLNDATSVTQQSGMETTEAALSDIVAGDILAVTLSSDNMAETIVILSTDSGVANPS